MIDLTGELVDVEDAQRFGLICSGIDAVEIEAAHSKQATTLPRCRFAVQVMVVLRFGVDADMISPIPFCAIHFNAFTMSLHEGVVIDLDFFH